MEPESDALRVVRTMLSDDQLAAEEGSGGKAIVIAFRTSLGPKNITGSTATIPANAKIGSPGNYFVDFWTQCQKMVKSDLLGPILRISGPKATKC